MTRYLRGGLGRPASFPIFRSIRMPGRLQAIACNRPHAGPSHFWRPSCPHSPSKPPIISLSIGIAPTRPIHSDEACRLAIEDDDWSDEKSDCDNSGETYVSGVWQGVDAAYRGPALPIPSQFSEAIRRKADHFETLLGVLKILAHVENLRGTRSSLLAPESPSRDRQGRGHPRERARSYG